MSSNMYQLGIDAWSIDDRLRLMEQIWESLPPVGLSEIPESLRAELDRRIAAAKATPEASRPWREVMAELMAGR